MYTDGETEAQKVKGDFFGRERLVRVAKKN